MSDDFDAEERAFREALRDAADAEGFRPMDADDLPRRAGSGRGWSTAVAAAVVIGVAGLLGVVVLPYLQDAGTSTTAGAAPAGSEAEAEDSGTAVPEMAPAPAREGGLEAAAPGFRWESFRDVVVQVPDDWGYGFAPTSAWCISEDWPEAPYVDLARGGGVVAAILCEGVMPAANLMPHLVFSEPDARPAESLPDGWSYQSRTAGSTAITVVTDAGNLPLAEQILGSAVEVEVDHNGCPVAAPSPDGGGLSPLAGAALTVCLYDYDTADVAGLRASAVLTGEAADRTWQAIAAAPAGGGPDASAASCSELPPDPSAGPVVDPVAFVLVDGRAFRFDFSGCTGNGLADASAQSAQRQVTAGLCRTMLVPPLWVGAAVGPAAEVCLAAVPRP